MKHALAILLLSASVVFGQPTLANSDDIAAAKARANHTGTQAHTTITGLGTAATADTSIVGGQNKVIKTDGNGNIVLGPFRTEAAATAAPELNGLNGNIIIPDSKYISWAASDNPAGGVYGASPSAGKLYAAIRYDRSHSGGGEWNFDATSRVCWYWNGGYQMGNAGGGTHYIYLHAGYATSGSTMKQSVPVAFNTSTWTGEAAVLNQMAIQCAPLDLSGTNSEMAIYRNATPGVTQTLAGQGTKIVSIASAGIWSNGTAPAFESLVDNTSITQTCSKYRTVQNAKVTLGGNRALFFANLEAGMRGVILVSQPESGGPWNLSAGGTNLDLSTTSSATDRVLWDYDGVYVSYSVTKAVYRDVPVSDLDAASFIASAAITNATHKAAVSTLVESLKTTNLWDKFYAIYPFVGGNAAAHSKDLKATYPITWAGTPTHDANGVTGNATDARGDTGINLLTLGKTNSASGYLYCRTTLPTDGAYLMGCTTSTTRFAMARSGANFGYHGPNSQVNDSFAATSNLSRHLLINRTSSTAVNIAVDSNWGAATSSVVSAPNGQIRLLCRESVGTPTGYTNANIAFAAFGDGISQTDWDALRGLIDTFQTTLSRTRP